MALTVPDRGEAQNDAQTVLFQEYLEVLVAAADGRDCVLSGCACTAQGTPDMTVAVAKGSVLSNGALLPVTAGNVTIGAADATNPRIDLIVVNSSGTKAVRAGTAAAAPKPPNRTANDVVLAAVYVPANDTTISSDQIVDMRAERKNSAIILKKTSTAVTFNSTLTIQTYFTITLPSGLLLAGQQLRIVAGGTFFNNSAMNSSRTLTLAYGGTTLFADATGLITADPDRNAWYLDVTLNASANNAQQITGVFSFQGASAQTAPTTGTAGDLSVTTQTTTPIRGTAAVDSDAADRSFTIQFTMSTSDPLNETVLDFAYAERC